MVAYLALEGPTGRSRLAGLLWPDSKESTARNNLAQAIRRLKNASGAPIVDGDDAIALRCVSSDVEDLFRAVESGAYAAIAQLGHELLAGFDLDDCPDFDVWLRGARTRVKRAWMRGAEGALAEFEAAGDLTSAIPWAERIVEAEPLSEAGHLKLARLHLARGDASAAMSAYDTCKRTLARELGMKPSAAMLEVYRAIREGRPRPARGADALPTVALRPKWVGRADEWKRLQAAVDARGWACVDGEPGVGKSRLVRDFADRRGDVILVEGRPGDLDVPFSTLTRCLRPLGARHGAVLPPWARAELARVLPELLGDEELPVPSTRSKVRFFEAVSHVFARATTANTTLIVDDLQWVDDASWEILHDVANRATRGELTLRIVCAYRTAELGANIAKDLRDAESARHLEVFHLEPLGASEIAELVRSLDIGEVGARAGAIAEAARGIPLYALEIVRSIAESNKATDEREVELPDRVRDLIVRRLDRLGEAALRVARIMSVAGPEFDLDLASFVLQASSLDLVDPLAELERAQVAEGTRFLHDVVAEAVRDNLPKAVREHLHAKTGEHLASKGADPARIAQHLEAGGRGAEAAPYLVKAGTAARGMSRIAEAGSFYDRASVLYERAGDMECASEALYLRSRSLMGTQADAIVERLERMARTDRDKARALCTRANVALELGRWDEARDAAKRAHPLARASGETLVTAESVQAWLDADIRTNRLEEAQEAFVIFRDASALLSDDPEAIAAILFYEAELFALADRHREAIAKFQEALALLERWGQLPHGKGGILAFVARSLLPLGRVDEASSCITQARTCVADATGAVQATGFVQLSHAAVLLARNDARGALDALERVPASMKEITATARTLAAEARVLVGEIDDGARELTEIARDETSDARARSAAAVASARITALRGAHVPEKITEVIDRFGSPEQGASLSCFRARGATEASDRLFETIFEVARSLELAPLEARAHAWRGDVRLATGRLEEAAADATAACRAVEQGVLWGLDAELALSVRARLDAGHRDAFRAYISAPHIQPAEIAARSVVSAFPHRAVLGGR